MVEDVRADRLLSLLLLLEGRGRITARILARELEVSVRTIYRDLEALGAAGVPVYAESGPGGGCQLLAGYHSPLSGLSREEADALLLLGVPDPLRQLGLGAEISAAQRKVRAAVGPAKYGSAPERIHLDMPAWFRTAEAVPHLAVVADAVRRDRRVTMTYQRGAGRVVDPLGLVNKAGVWYLVAQASKGPTVYRVARITAAAASDETFARPADFDLARFWAEWSAEFASSRPQLTVLVRASPGAMHAFPEIFGDSVRPKIKGASPPDADGWRTLTLSFEHEEVAAYRLAGFGGTVEVLEPATVRGSIVAGAKEILGRYQEPI